MSRLPLLVALIAVEAVAGGLSALGVSSAVLRRDAGEKRAVVPHYSLSNIHYALSPTAPADIDLLMFDVSPSLASTGAVVVQTGLKAGGWNTYACKTNNEGDAVTCSTASPRLTVDKLSFLTVFASDLVT